MRIDQILGKGLPAVSFKFFPPKTDAGFQQLFQTIEELNQINPSYVSVTYGAGGSTRQKTVELVERIQREAKIRAMAHRSDVRRTADQIGATVAEVSSSATRAGLAPRGERAAGRTQCGAAEGVFGPANEGDQLAAAGYPEGHPQ